jgi:hypothetical protein
MRTSGIINEIIYNNVGELIVLSLLITNIKIEIGKTQNNRKRMVDDDFRFSN